MNQRSFALNCRTREYFAPVLKNEAQRTGQDCYHLMFGIDHDGDPHACVGLNGKLVHDPHPLRRGFKNSPDEWSIGLMVSRNPDGVLPPLSWAGRSGMKEVDPRAYAMPGTVSGEPKPSLLTGVVSFIHLAIPVQQVRADIEFVLGKPDGWYIHKDNRVVMFRERTGEGSIPQARVEVEADADTMKVRSVYIGGKRQIAKKMADKRKMLGGLDLGGQSPDSLSIAEYLKVLGNVSSRPAAPSGTVLKAGDSVSDQPDASKAIEQEGKGAKVLWGGSEPLPATAGQQPLYAGKPDESSGQATPIAQGQSDASLP